MIWFDMIWFCSVWFDMIWFCSVWFDTIWFCLVWVGLVWSGIFEKTRLISIVSKPIVFVFVLVWFGRVKVTL